MNNEYSVRRMEEKDVEQIVAIEKDTFSQPWSEVDFRKAWKDSHNIYFVVEKGREIIGYCGLWSVVDEGQITNVAIRRDARGQGLATKMMTALLEEGIKEGLTAFTLEVRVGNHSARSVYKKLGFEEAGVRPNFYDHPKEDAVIMWKYMKNVEY